MSDGPGHENWDVKVPYVLRRLWWAVETLKRGAPVVDQRQVALAHQVLADAGWLVTVRVEVGWRLVWTPAAEGRVRVHLASVAALPERTPVGELIAVLRRAAAPNLDAAAWQRWLDDVARVGELIGFEAGRVWRDGIRRTAPDPPGREPVRSVRDRAEPR